MGLLTSLLIGSLFAYTYHSIENHQDEAFDAVLTADGGYLVAGSAGGSFASGEEDVILLKIDSTGNVEWARSYGGNKYDKPSDILQTADGNYVIAGFHETDGGAYLLLMKTDPLGNLIWARAIGPIFGEDFNLIQTADGGFAVGTSTKNFGAGMLDFILIKTDSSGNFMWAKTYGTPESDIGHGICLKSSEGFIFVGETHYSGSSIMVLEIDSQGNLLKSKRFFLSEPIEWAFRIIRFQSGYCIAGVKNDPDHVFRMFVMSTDSSINPQWAYGVQEATYSITARIIATHDNQLLMGGGYQDFIFFLFDSTGDIPWARNAGSGNAGMEMINSLIEIPEGGYLLVGNSAGYYPMVDMYIVRVDSAGQYPPCVQPQTAYTVPSGIGTLDFAPTVTSPVLDTFTPDLEQNTPVFVADEGCPPPGVRETNKLASGSDIRVSIAMGSLIFIVPWESSVRIYLSDGRLIHSGRLKKGVNKVELGRGLYFWMIGPYRGSSVVQ